MLAWFGIKFFTAKFAKNCRKERKVNQL